MSTSPAPLRPVGVVVVDGALHVRELVDTDSEVVKVIGDADDPVAATHHCLRIGARAVRAANTAVDVDVVERSFEALALRLDDQVTGAVEQISGVADQLLGGDDGALTVALAGFHEGLDSLLGSTFDPDSKASVISKIETLMEETNLRAVEAVRKLVAPEGDDNPLARMKAEILTGVKGEIVDVVREIRDVATQLGIDAARQEEAERGTAKGFAFEDVLDGCVGRLAADHGDLHEQCGTEMGGTGSKVGDEVVTLNLADSYGVETRFVFEAKDRKLAMRKILAELDEAMANRGASFGIGVFRTQEVAPTSVPFHCVGDDKLIVVLDDDSDLALRLAYLWARTTVRAGLAAVAGDEIDVERMSALVADARRALEALNTVKSCHSKARNAIDQAGTHVQALVENVRASLDQLEAELSATEAEAA